MIKKKEISNYQARVIEFQLGRKADNLLGISRICPFEQPAVLLTHPFQKGQGVFPTTYWLSCPYLVKEVARIENEGLIRELTSRMQNEEGFKRELRLAHRHYAHARYSLLTTEQLQELEEQAPNILQVIKESGVGGIIDQQGIKCLHTHLADFLVNGQNPVGKLVWEKTGWPEGCQLCEMGVKENETWSY